MQINQGQGADKQDKQAEQATPSTPSNSAQGAQQQEPPKSASLFAAGWFGLPLLLLVLLKMCA